MIADEGNAEITLSLIALGPGSEFSETALFADIAATWPDLPAATAVEKPEPEGTASEIADKSLFFRLGDTMVVIGFMPVAIPWSAIEGPCETSILFPDASAILKSHEAHVTISLQFNSERSPVERAALLTQVTASFVNVCKASLGVYWGNATMVLPPVMFREIAVESFPPGGPPSLLSALVIWVDARVGPNQQGNPSGFTCGLEALGLMEVEVEDANESPSDLLDRLRGTAYYLLKNGLVFKKGENVGETKTDQINVRFGPSSFGHEGQVVFLDYHSTSDITDFNCASNGTFRLS